MSTTSQSRSSKEGKQVAPQPNTAPQSDAATATEDDSKRAEREWTELVQRATVDDNPASRQIKRAIQLERELSAMRKRVNDNREYLRLMDRNEELTEDQAVFLDTFYPEKEKGERRSAEEVEATRKAREFARKAAEENGAAKS